MANYFDGLLNKVFGNASKLGVSHKENFALTSERIQEVNEWLDESEGEDLLNRLYNNYYFKKNQINERPQVHLFSTKYANGFAITFEDPLTPESFNNVFHAFSARILDMGYKQVSLDRKIEEKVGKVLEVEKFYFKPPLQMPEEGQLISQLFGNVALEKVITDNQPSYLKLLATVYSDRLYQDAWPFDDFMDRLFKK
ncbi:hypothetical protein ACFOSV_08660 [Algoriphagus namhaensis]|uniref:Uncharacterized protein n=1 Tax=Algoriphagus namhaensis TaxID=915353 RepID=A0ABV8AU13_9BACT